MGDIGMIKRGGACLVAQARRRGRQLHSRTGRQQRRSRSLPKRRGGRNNKYNANISMTMRDKTINSVRDVLTQGYTIPAKGENIRESFPEVWHFRTDETEGEGCTFAMLGTCGGRTGCVTEFVSSF